MWEGSTQIGHYCSVVGRQYMFIQTPPIFAEWLVLSVYNSSEEKHVSYSLFGFIAPHPSLQVSAGDNKVLTLPLNTISLYASAWPKETSGLYNVPIIYCTLYFYSCILPLLIWSFHTWLITWLLYSLENPYSYHWQQISAPEGSHGYMEGQDSRRVILSQVCISLWR